MAAAPAPLSPDELHAILTAFPNRWLLASELHRLLHGFAAAGVPVLQAVVRRPPSGSFFLYDASLRVRDDGYEYTRKQLAGGRREIKESYVKLVVQGVPRLACFTSELEERPSFRRRIYRLLDADGDGSGGAAAIQLVHYLDVEAAAAAAKAGGGGKRAEETAHRPPSTSYVSGCPLCGGPNPVLAPLPAVSGSSFHFSAAIGSARPAARPPDLPRRIPGLTSSSDDDGMPPSTAAAPPLPRTPPSGLPSLSALDPGTGTGPFDDWDLGAHLSGDLGIYVEDTPVGSAAVPPGTGPLAAASQWGGTHPILQPASANVAPFPATLQPVTGGTHGGGDWAAASASVSASTEDDAGVSDAESDTHQTGTGSAPPSTVEGRTNRLLQRLMAQVCEMDVAALVPLSLSTLPSLSRLRWRPLLRLLVKPNPPAKRRFYARQWPCIRGSRLRPLLRPCMGLRRQGAARGAVSTIPSLQPRKLS